jgi:hypothetical protein
MRDSELKKIGMYGKVTIAKINPPKVGEKVPCS